MMHIANVYIVATAAHKHATTPALNPSLLAATGTIHRNSHVALIEMHTALQAAEAVGTLIPAQATANGKTESMYQVQQTPVWSVSSSVLPTILQKRRRV